MVWNLGVMIWGLGFGVRLNGNDHAAQTQKRTILARPWHALEL